MSFPNKSFWMQRDAGCTTDGEMGYDTPSKLETKRSHQWLMDGSAQEIFSNKKQVTEAINNRSMPGISNLNSPPWENTSGFQPFSRKTVLIPTSTFGYDPVRTINLPDRNISNVGIGNLHMDQNNFDNQFGNTSLVTLSMSHAMEDSSCLSQGSKNGNANQVGNSENSMSVLMGHPYGRGDHAISMGPIYTKNENSISLGLTYNSGAENTSSIGPNFNTADESLILMGQTFHKRDGAFNYNKGNDSILLMGKSLDKGKGKFIARDQPYEKGGHNLISPGAVYNKGHENFNTIGTTYNRVPENFMSMGPTHDMGDDNIVSVGATHDKASTTVASMHTSYDKDDSSILSIGHRSREGEGTTISFQKFQDEHGKNNHSGSIINNSDLLVSQPAAQTLKESGQIVSVECNSDPVVIVAPATTSKTNSAAKNKQPKTPKKIPPNSFPSNVKSLLSTGILDGVPVKYVSWSREKNLRGIIKGTSYLCGCRDCNFSKSVNAFEFERHAGCKTKHPNDHIYFGNGKTIFAVVQELKITPPEVLFEIIPNVTGSPINQKNFDIWKASFQAATRELQRIFGKDEVVMPS